MKAMSTTDGFQMVGRLSEFKQGRGRAVRVGDIKVAIFRFGDRFHAIQDRCPHMGASLADGRVLDGWVECFWHGWTFNLEDGRSDQKSRQWLCADVYETKVEQEALWVRVPPAAPTEPVPQADDWVVWDNRYLKIDSASPKTDGDERSDQGDDKSQQDDERHGTHGKGLPDE
jgi:nitrite reductase/ring-hydroxylating ferredoxin subunit